MHVSAALVYLSIHMMDSFTTYMFSDNDTVIGNKNRIKAQRPSALKNHNLVQNRSTQSIPLHITENSMKTRRSKGLPDENCLRERKGSALKLTSPTQPPRTGKPSSKGK